ncbi:T9SS type A sorting domain-containing protein [Mariniflexile sp.]|uniref:T9SS type A sorting domain-containing protein n=2 Tax=Mariniflexile sp. TaxID=1979402 RepID=UPI0040482A75
MKKPKTILLLIITVLNTATLFAQNVSIGIDANNVYQTMDGFGTSLRVFNDPHIIGGTTSAPITAGLTISTAEEDGILNLLYNDLGLTRVRPATGEDGAIEDPNDNNDPNITDPSQFDFGWKKMDAHIDYVSRVIPRGVTTFFPSTIKIESWMTVANPEEYAEWAFMIIKRWKDQGYELSYYSIINEPGYTRGGIWPGTYIRDCIKLLGPKLDAAGINTKMVIPDDLNADEAFTRSQIILDDSVARSYVGALAYHLYGGSNANKTAMMQLGQQYNIPIWMTEYSRPDAFAWGNQIHDVIANYGVSAVDHMWGFFGQQETNGTQLIRLNFTGTNYTGYTINKQYYVTGQYSKFVKPGARRIESISSNNDVRVTAFRDGVNVSIVVLNNHGNSQTVDFSLNGLNNITTLKAVRTSLTENLNSLGDITVLNDSFSTILPANSITTFYNDQLLSVVENPTSNPGFTIIYPNPASEIVTVKLTSVFNGETKIQITDINGKLVLAKTVRLNNQISEIPIRVNNLSNGIYLINIQAEGKQYSKKLLIHH